MSARRRSTKAVFRVLLIKPSHYDDDGYVIQWVRSSIPSNTLAALYGLALDAAHRQVLGPDVDIQLDAHDETNTRIQVKRLVRLIRSSSAGGMVALVGVQSNQYPRAMDLARQLRAEGIQVCIGGFHVSGSLAMLPVMPRDLQEAVDLGVSLFAGELEGRMDELLLDAFRRELKPLYNYMKDLPDLGGSPVPFLPAAVIHRRTGAKTSFDAGRGCPFQCSFCTIINVQGRKSRFRSPDDIERIVRANVAQGVSNFFISDDNFARNRTWEPILDRLIHLREVERISLRLIIQVDTLSHKVPGFIHKAGRAGVNRVFIGLENIHPESLLGAQKRQNRIEEYRAMLDAWHSVGALTLAGYILGFPVDTPESILRDIKIIQRELPIDLLEFFILTPLPGSQDHRALYDRGVAMDPDMNHYDLAHVTTDHQQMSRREWQAIYHRAWDAYYTPEHVEALIRRGKAWGFPPRQMMEKLLAFHACARIERVHPLEGGLFRLKYRRDRRPGLPHDGPLAFYGRYLWDILSKHGRFVVLALSYLRALYRVEAGVSRAGAAMGAALRPISAPPAAVVETPEAVALAER
ncbi:MAG: radical SAM protein [Omnitrophica WOR_2 bacterium RIFCSPHIGHO2_02_FULL_67_20]|nr:MAG: radical SAM protein [Omnitrophica WOR_2 bacterium RIFCSPHIGHO2_02_FULL_67_20]